MSIGDPAMSDGDAAMSGTEAPSWPPEGADPLDMTDLYPRLAERGFQYGPAFQGLRAAWTSRDEVYADVRVDAGRAARADAFVLHPALLDSALHAVLAPLLDREDGMFLPMVLRGIQVRRPGASAMRVTFTPNGENSVSLSAVDESGAPVASVSSIVIRPVSMEQLNAIGTDSGGRLLRVVWKRFQAAPADPATQASSAQAPGTQTWAFLGTDHFGVTGALKGAGRQVAFYQSLHALDAGLRDGDATPSLVIVSFPNDCEGSRAVRVAAERALVMLQAWLSDQRLAGSSLVFVTHGAVSAAPDEGYADLAGAAVWGLVRSAQTEHPGRFALVDLDDLEASGLVAALSTAEPQLAIRGGVQLRPRLTRCPPAARGEQRRWDPEATIVITGGTGALGQLIARHLVTAQGARHLILLSRRGPGAPGAAAIAAELTKLGADVRLVAADAADRTAMAGILAAIPAAHPLAAVVHCAGIAADATVARLSPRGLDRVLRPKVDAALVLDELTPDCDLILFSSVSGLLGGAGQGNYAAANACLDALAHRRAAAGRRGISLAWGLWDDGMADRLGSADLDRMARYGMGMMSVPEGLALFTAALNRGGQSLGEPLLVPLRLNEKTLRSGAALPEMLTDLAPRTAARTVGPSDARAFRDALAALPEQEHEDAVVAFVRAQVAAVLGIDGAENVDPHRELAELGFDSLTNLELGRNLSAATGLRLPATLSFDYPTAAELGRHLVRLLT